MRFSFLRQIIVAGSLSFCGTGYADVIGDMKAMEVGMQSVARCSEMVMQNNRSAIQQYSVKVILPTDTPERKEQKLQDQSRIDNEFRAQVVLLQSDLYACFEKGFPISSDFSLSKMVVLSAIQTGNDLVDLLNKKISFGDFNQRQELLKREYGGYTKCLMNEMLGKKDPSLECRIPKIDPMARYPQTSSECYRKGFSFYCN
jgi:hypothetical protein